MDTPDPHGPDFVPGPSMSTGARPLDADAAMTEIREALRSPGGKITLPFTIRLNGPSRYGVQAWIKTKKAGPLILPKEDQSLGDVLHMLGDLVEREGKQI